MTISAIAIFNPTDLNIDNVDGTISIPFRISISNSTSTSTTSFNASGVVNIPLGLNAKKSNNSLRASIASFMLTLDPTFIIAPDDIYFPMVN